ncbi:MAG: hypothetical protein GWO39_07760 [Gammaproteobacteria bacterium]|nr:hypothetical protein [Gammaproteobacteria bacterium]NIY32254.1 hypothetical protein [Gammaproteobacteria bacterium]
MTGDTFVCSASNQTTFRVAVNGGTRVPFRAGWHWAPFRGQADRIRQVEIFNPNATALTISFELATGELIDRALILAGGAVQTEEQSADTLSPAEDVTLSAAIATQVAPVNTARRRVLITNLAGNTNTIRVGDVSVSLTRGAPVAPGQTITLETTAAVYAWSTGSQDVAVLEVERS